MYLPLKVIDLFWLMSCLLGFVTQCSWWCVFGWKFAHQKWGCWTPRIEGRNLSLMVEFLEQQCCQDDLDFLVGFWFEDLHIRMVVENMGSWCYGILWEGGQLQERNKAFLAASQTCVSFKNALLTPYFLGGSVRGGRFTSLWNPSTQASSPILRIFAARAGTRQMGVGAN